MELQSLLPIVVAVLAGFVVLRLLIGAIRMSAKLMVWGVLAAAVFGLGYLWYQNQDPENPIELPALNIPAPQQPAP